jgi:outer membrane immunogenic protein
MKKLLMAAVAIVAIVPAAHAQDKSGRTFNNQQSTTTTTRTTTPAPTYTSTVDTSSTSWGPYIGAYGGYGWTSADTAVGDLDVDGADYGGLIGFKVDHLLQGLGITGAVEAYYGDSNAEDDLAGVTIEKGQEWGVNFRPGLSFLNYGTQINPYGIIGYRRTEFETSGGAFAGDETYDGFDLGIGTEIVSWNNVGLRADYTHTWYEEKNGLDPDENNVRVGLIYHFE